MKVKEILGYLKQCERVFSASLETQKVLYENGIKSEQCYFYADIDSLSMWDGCEKKYDVIQASRMMPHKHFEIVVQSAKHKNWEIVFTGGHQDQNYTSHIANLTTIGTADFSIRGRLSREDFILALRQSRVLVSASDFEGWGLSPVEALLCDIPVVLRDIPVFREVYGDSIFYFDTAPQLSEKISLLLGDRILYNDVVEGGRKCIEEFTPKKFARRWEKLIS